ncbi:MAG: 2-(1,2-epoxy,2-dihydrophenyl)acetyl-CoA isomerase [Solirubrobacteraceae bacterium]|jgi:2-(1,2-epoxy-1,2-dihydrophenyl)acetyl-CoA isomerase|nr:2-(1,2-epoxy,2-dihydrophenyl)acetyl-CoA isomerase [Solirubrobacteraceae bacterium]
MSAIDLQRAGGVATIRLDRPDRLNAFDPGMSAELLAAVRDVAADASVRAVVLTGAGRAFSSGLDLATMDDDVTAPDGRPDLERILVERFHPVVTCIRAMPKPVVAVVRGPAVGVGVSLALCCDLVVASESAYFLLAFVNLGLVPDGGASLLVPSRVGMARALRMAMLGEPMGAREAADCGLIDRACADDELDAELDALVARLAAGPTQAYAAIKRQLNHWLLARMPEHLELEASMQQELAGTADFREGVTAFVEKRAPRFTGS